MPKQLAFDQIDDRVSARVGDLATLVGAVERLRRTVVGAELSREELKALVALQRAMQSQPLQQTRSHPEGIEAKDNRYGSHQPLPEDWHPTQTTLAWAESYLARRGISYDMDWLIDEFRSYWRMNGRIMANWNQCFRNNILTKISRGLSLAPAPTPGRTNGKSRLADKQADLRAQRLADFDREAADYLEGTAPRRSS